MKKLYLILAFVCLASLSYSQMRLAIQGGPHSASVKETNSIPGWASDIKPGYSSRTALNLGILAEIPLSANNRWFLQPGISYLSKGRKYYMRNDTAQSIQTDTISSSYNLAVNYIDIPLFLTYKLPLGKRSTFNIGAGPYIGFFYNGTQKSETRIYSSNSFKDDETRLESGDEEGKMKTFNAGFNLKAGFELGNVLISGFFSQGLNSFYTAPYEGSFIHQVKGVSVGFWLNKAKQLQRPVRDRDKDGVADNADRCPTLAGSSFTEGCPDRDDDGIADQNDKCPELAGTKKYQGCPVPDTDGDGINDEADTCPTTAGEVEFNGCPVPDMDGDGLNDREDRCPTEAGDRKNNGCPVVDTIKKEIREKVAFAAKDILFEAASDRLSENSYGALNEVVTVLRANSQLRMSIEGHTDSTGNEKTNIQLSQARAETVKKYLIDKGIDAARLQSIGYGSAKPLTTNETAEGRKINRRVELKLLQ